MEDELIFDPLLDSSDIRVQNMGGDVAMNGTVPSYPDYLEAAAAARRVAGVAGVHNHLSVVLPPGDERDDPLLTATANNALELDITVSETVEAAAHNGYITPTGTVRYGYQRSAPAEATARPPAGQRLKITKDRG